MLNHAIFALAGEPKRYRQMRFYLAFSALGELEVLGQRPVHGRVSRVIKRRPFPAVRVIK